MDIKYDFSDIGAFLDRGYQETVDKMSDVGKEAVVEAKETGSYQDITGNLRRSNDYKVSRNGLELVNRAHYASNVEARGKIVLSSAALYAEKRLKEEFG